MTFEQILDAIGESATLYPSEFYGQPAVIYHLAHRLPTYARMMAVGYDLDVIDIYRDRTPLGAQFERMMHRIRTARDIKVVVWNHKNRNALQRITIERAHAELAELGVTVLDVPARPAPYLRATNN